MNKVKSVIWIIVGVTVCYLFMIIAMPFLSSVANDSATIIETEHDLENYMGAKEGLQAMPWVLYFVPAVVGGVALVIVLKRKEP